MIGMDNAFFSRQVGLVNGGGGGADALHVLIVHYYPVPPRKAATGRIGNPS
jgi:hypothetical protein